MRVFAIFVFLCVWLVAAPVAAGVGDRDGAATAEPAGGASDGGLHLAQRRDDERRWERDRSRPDRERRRSERERRRNRERRARERERQRRDEARQRDRARERRDEARQRERARQRRDRAEDRRRQDRERDRTRQRRERDVAQNNNAGPRDGARVPARSLRGVIRSQRRFRNSRITNVFVRRPANTRSGFMYEVWVRSRDGAETLVYVDPDSRRILYEAPGRR